MQRREFILKTSLAGCSILGWAGCRPTGGNKDIVMTVTGPISSSEMGFTLSHEHILVDFIGAKDFSPDRYNPDAVAKRYIPYLKELHKLGVRTFIECTPDYLGRDPALMRRISGQTGVQILTNTGYYGAHGSKFIPAHAIEESAEQLADRWIREANKGINDTGILPGFIKISVNKGSLTEMDRKLVRAAAITHRETGLLIASHTSLTAESGNQQLEILKDEGVSPDAWVWVHASTVEPIEELSKAFEAGAWISFDKLRPNEKSVSRMCKCLAYAKKNGWLDQVLLSHDAGWYDPAKPDGGSHYPYTTYFTHLLQVAESWGLSGEELHRIMTLNPARAFSIKTR